MGTYIYNFALLLYMNFHFYSCLRQWTMFFFFDVESQFCIFGFEFLITFLHSDLFCFGIHVGEGYTVLQLCVGLSFCLSIRNKISVAFFQQLFIAGGLNFYTLFVKACHMFRSIFFNTNWSSTSW